MTRQTENIPISDIFRKYQSQLKSFISKRVPSKEDCEDILQNVFYQLLKTDSEGTVIGQVSAWLYSVADEQRTVFELTELEGFSFKEISEATDVPVNTLLSRKRYAVLHLRKWLNDLYIELVGD